MPTPQTQPHPSIRPQAFFSTLTRYSLGAAAALLLMSAAGAQTAGYTVKAINPPFTGSWTNCGAQFIADNGDVAGRCSAQVGLVFQSGFPIRLVQYRPVVWRAGSSTPTTLSVPAGQSAYYIHGIDAQGRVAASMEPTSRGSITATVTYSGSQRISWPVMYDPVGFYVTDGVNAQGQVAFSPQYPTGASSNIVIAGPNGTQNVPPPPNVAAGQGKVEMRSNLAGWMITLNDLGQIALVTSDDNPDFNDYRRLNARAWFWNGKAWLEIPGPDGGTWPGNESLAVRSLNNAGQVLLSEYTYVGQQVRMRRYLWREGSAPVALPDDVQAYASNGLSKVADNGDVVGTAPFATVKDLPRYGLNRAAVWRNGQLIDLNTLAQAPSGYTFVEVADVNTKGQMLVWMDSLSVTTSTSRLRPVILTPR